MYLWLILAVIFAVLEAIAVARHIQILEYIAKPAVMICLWLWLYANTGLQGNALWFGLGILLSLAGDVLLMLPRESLFLFGLVAFLFAHVFYITGFREEIATFSGWSFLLLVFLGISVRWLVRRIVGAMRLKGVNQLIIPVIVYGAVISIMLYAAMSTIYDPTWKTSAALLVSLGALLFWLSDIILAWNKFVAPIKNGWVLNITIYHLGQIGLIAGVVSQFP